MKQQRQIRRPCFRAMVEWQLGHQATEKMCPFYPSCWGRKQRSTLYLAALGMICGPRMIFQQSKTGHCIGDNKRSDFLVSFNFLRIKTPLLPSVVLAFCQIIWRWQKRDPVSPLQTECRISSFSDLEIGVKQLGPHAEECPGTSLGFNIQGMDENHHSEHSLPLPQHVQALSPMYIQSLNVFLAYYRKKWISL